MRARRPPPPLEVVTVQDVERVTPRLVRVRFSGSLAHFEGVQPAASLRLLVPTAGDLELPTWNGNEYLLPDGSRPPIRTLTPLRPGGGTLDVEVVVHGAGPASEWAERAAPGQRAAISGPGRGYDVPTDARHFVIAGDESAVPAIGQVLAALPQDVAAEVHIEAAAPEARVALPRDAQWHFVSAPGEGLVAAVHHAQIDRATRVWVAGEAAAVQRVRRYLFEERGVARSMTWVRGYWKHGRAGDTDEEVV